MFDYNYQFNTVMYNQQLLNSNFGNLQNQFTPGYKADNLSFSDVMGNTGGYGGAKQAARGVVFTQGQVAKTGNTTDLAVNGQGLLIMNDGSRNHYSRDGRLYWNNGSLSQVSTNMPVMGFPLDDQGNISGKLANIRLDLDPQTKLFGGRYQNYRFDNSGKLYGESTIVDPMTKQAVTTSVPLYQVGLASFPNLSGLQRSGTTSFVESENSGQSVVGVAGQGALGQVVPESVELANVDFAQQSAAIGLAKMGYDANVSAFKTMDRLTQTAIGLIR